MESNNTGADEASRRERREAEKRAIFEKIRQEMLDRKPITREELERKIAAIRERNRLRREEEQRKRNEGSGDQEPDKPVA